MLPNGRYKTCEEGQYTNYKICANAAMRSQYHSTKTRDSTTSNSTCYVRPIALSAYAHCADLM
jgi:hypothetical protein